MTYTDSKSGTSAVARFRWTTIQRALDVLEAEKTNARMVALIEELGGGPDIDRLPAALSTTPKLRNLLSRLAREEGRTDTEGTPIGERLVQEAAATFPVYEPRPWDTDPPHLHPHHAALQQALTVDGWAVIDARLLPATPVPVPERRSRLRSSLLAYGAAEALSRLDQLEAGLDEGHWESANGDARGFLNSVFEVIADQWPPTAGQALREGAARTALQRTGFFKASENDATKSYEGDLVKSLAAFLGSDGAHTGSSDSVSAGFRFALAVLAADYFLERLGSRSP
jgi:hypothetical protein